MALVIVLLYLDAHRCRRSLDLALNAAQTIAIRYLIKETNLMALKNKHYKTSKGTVLLTSFISLVFLILSCGPENGEGVYRDHRYLAKRAGDSALLNLSMSGSRFVGTYEIRYANHMKDSGDVRGKILGDTLRGDFHYRTYGGSMKRMPLALLRRDRKLYMGKGAVGTYMNIPCFMPGVPIEYDSTGFVFSEVRSATESD